MGKKPTINVAEILQKHGVFVRVPLEAMNHMADQSVPVIIQARRIHEIWMRAGTRDGWTYGFVRDTNNLRDPRMIPFDDLSEAQQCEFFDIASSMRRIHLMD